VSRLLAAHSVHGAFSRSHGLCLPLLRPINGSERRANAPHVPVDARWRPLLVQASALKEALDHGLRWKGPHATDDWVRDVLAANGIDLDHARPLASEAALKCAFPDHFAQLLLGSWFRAGDEYRSVGWVTIPEWSVLGWVRKDQYRNTVLDSAATLRLKINGLERRVAMLRQSATPPRWDRPRTPSRAYRCFGPVKARTELSSIVWVRCLEPLRCMCIPVQRRSMGCACVEWPGSKVLRRLNFLAAI